VQIGTQFVGHTTRVLKSEEKVGKKFEELLLQTIIEEELE